MAPAMSQESVTLLATAPCNKTIRRGSLSLTAASSRRKAATKEPAHVDFVQAKEPKVGYIEAFRFFVWAIVVILVQLYNDVRERHNGFATIFAADLISHFFFIPVGRITPRLVIRGPHERLHVRVIPKGTTRRYEELKDIDKFPEKEMINCVSNNYGGFSKLEDDATDLIEQTISVLPFTDGPEEFEVTLRKECAAYMGFDVCELAPSGFSSNMLAFQTVNNLAEATGKKCIFLCDRDCHNSMFTGAYTNKNAVTHKFDHNDINDLEQKLRILKQQDPGAFVCVAVEGLYSMEGTTGPIPAILALKKIYGFKLLVDEAHSFLSLGSTGRGSFNYWQDLGYDCPLKDADIMTCMFSKSVGCTGGMVLANGAFATQLAVEGHNLASHGSEKLSTAVIVRVLGLLRKPQLIRRRMAALRSKATYAAHMLSKAGCKVLSSPGSPIVCFPVGTVRQVAVLHDEAFHKGVALVGGVPPATPLWGCRIRMAIFASIDWADLRSALTTTIDICVKHKVPGVKKIFIDPYTLPKAILPSDVEITTSKVVDGELYELVNTLAQRDSNYPRKNDIGSHPKVLAAGTSALKTYGIGPCSARWYYGSFDVFVRLEQRLAGLYPSITRHSGRCRAMVCGDADVTIGSSFAARAIAPRTKNIDNLVLLASSAPHFVHKAVSMSKESSTRRVIHFDSVQDVPKLLAQERNKTKRSTYLTIYLEVIDKDTGAPLDLLPLLRTISRLSPVELTGACIFLDDRNGLGKLGPKKLGYLNYMEDLHGDDFLVKALGRRSSSVQVLVAGSWYNAFGHQGGYVTGAAPVVENLTWDARAFFFSTPPMPLQTAMSDKALELLAEGGQ